MDPSRKETYENVPGNNRALNIQIWYPADRTEGFAAAPYAADLPVIAEALGRQYGIPKQLFSYFNLVKTYAYQEPPVSKTETAYPVVLFSHGFPGGRYTNTFQTVELASHGFIVVAVEHTLSSFTTVFPGGRYIGLSPNQPKPSDISAWDDMINSVWLKDIRLVLDRLEDLNRQDDKNLLTGALDLSRIGMLGHSFGGANAAQALLLDQRVKAAINMDGTFFGKGDLSRGLPRPFLLMSSDLPPQPADASAEPTDSQLAAAGLTRELFDKQLRQIPLRKQEAMRNGGKELIIPHATHLSFCDFYLWFPMMVWANGQTEDPHRTHRTINKATVAFFEENLR
ncbi:alpha/beta hydrolase family protein [Paenibacillus zanthoxyli]|uniref:alpha/beta hydrolase family protein n=1 Tax=Paenibacillus zanthoxyli TaxID=369399 RepID=UPI000A02EC55|nr:alpha/beta fold hydrolase [Paenibacillus zanthoxyli]